MRYKCFIVRGQTLSPLLERKSNYHITYQQTLSAPAYQPNKTLHR
jgi:hypothetical protein